ncbi:hypothetical protein ACQ2H7_003100 [Candidozyma auris]
MGGYMQDVDKKDGPLFQGIETNKSKNIDDMSFTKFCSMSDKSEGQSRRGVITDALFKGSGKQRDQR